MRKVEQAFNQCLQQHDSCPRSKVGLLPSRVVDVEAMGLYEAGEGELGTYAALSQRLISKKRSRFLLAFCQLARANWVSSRFLENLLAQSH